MATYSGSDKRLQYLFQHGGGGSLEDLDDVEITSVEDGQGLVYDEDSGKWVNGEGGGGNANEQVLTKAEYDALTEEQKMNNTTYYINDADTWTSKEVQPVIYSTEEREIGVWIDGKPLYQKTTVYNSTNVSGGQIEQDVSSLNIDTCVYLDGFCDRSGTGYGPLWYRFNCYENDNYFAFLRYDDYNNNHNIVYKIKFGTGEITSKQVITIRYTKTTDQAGSGIYTPQGQLAVHYSTEEHIIGTWIDGKPLYQKVVTGKTVSFSTAYGQLGYYTTVNFNNELSNIDTMWLDTVHSFYVMNGQHRGFNFFAHTSGTSMDIFVEANRSNASCTFVLQYTKTTD